MSGTPATRERETGGSLTVVGTGLRFAGDLTLAARDCIEHADRVFFGVDDVASAALIQRLNPTATNLVSLSQAGHDRFDAYTRVVEALLEPVRDGKDVCAVFYGHPGYYVYPSHVAIERARAEGHRAEMMAGVSALDWLFADLGVDPSTRGGMRLHGAAEWLLRRRPADPCTDLVLMQAGLLHVMKWRSEHERGTTCLALLRDRLVQIYGAEHEAVAYVASSYAAVPPRIDRFAVGALCSVPISAETTLWIPQLAPPEIDTAMQAALAEARGLAAPRADA